MYKKARLVHGDVSAFNILIYRKKPYLIDVGQGVLLGHPNSHDFLKRDIKNMEEELLELIYKKGFKYS